MDLAGINNAVAATEDNEEDDFGDFGEAAPVTTASDGAEVVAVTQVDTETENDADEVWGSVRERTRERHFRWRSDGGLYNGDENDHAYEYDFGAFEAVEVQPSPMAAASILPNDDDDDDDDDDDERVEQADLIAGFLRTHRRQPQPQRHHNDDDDDDDCVRVRTCNRTHGDQAHREHRRGRGRRLTRPGGRSGDRDNNDFLFEKDNDDGNDDDASKSNSKLSPLMTEETREIPPTDDHPLHPLPATPSAPPPTQPSPASPPAFVEEEKRRRRR